MSHKKKNASRTTAKPKRDRFGHFVAKRPSASKKPAHKPARVLTEDPVCITKTIEAVGRVNEPLRASSVTLADFALLAARHRDFVRRYNLMRDIAFAKDGHTFREKFATVANDARQTTMRNEHLENANRSLVSACERANDRAAIWKTLAIVSSALLIAAVAMRTFAL